MKTTKLTLTEAIDSGRPFRMAGTTTWYKYDKDENELFDIEDHQNTRDNLNIRGAVEPLWEVRMAETFQRGEVERLIRKGVGYAVAEINKDPNLSSFQTFEMGKRIASKIMESH